MYVRELYLESLQTFSRRGLCVRVEVCFVAWRGVCPRPGRWTFPFVETGRLQLELGDVTAARRPGYRVDAWL
jgi:hypothetical protein